MSNAKRSREPKQSILPNHKSVKVTISSSELSEIMDARLKAFEDLILRRIKDTEARLLGEIKVTLAALTCEVESLRQRVTDLSDKLGSGENQFSSLRGEKTWLCPALPDSLFILAGYCLLRADRQGRAGGVAIFYRAGLKTNGRERPPNVETTKRHAEIDTESRSFAAGSHEGGLPPTPTPARGSLLR
uniref:Uncharacterized protein n=1 Tax=Glossina morsitans morsitans TaxID=37546 RepID=A0A1B0GBC5_GLOMM